MKMGECLLNIAMWVTVFPAMVAGALFLIGSMMETVAENSAQHDRCLKQAANGYEMRRCR